MPNPIQVLPYIWLVGSAELTHQYDCCVYLIDTGDGLVLIDSGAGRSFSRIGDNIRLLNLTPDDIGTVIVTHAHIDHIGALADFQREYGSVIIAHELDAPALESGQGTGAEFYGVPYRPVKVDRMVSNETEVIKFGRYELNFRHIPGHTPGSMAIYIDADGERILFGQDIHGPYEARWGADRKSAAKSLDTLISLKADILCEGHFGIIEPAAAITDFITGYRRAL